MLDGCSVFVDRSINQKQTFVCIWVAVVRARLSVGVYLPLERRFSFGLGAVRGVPRGVMSEFSQIVGPRPHTHDQKWKGN